MTSRSGAAAHHATIIRSGNMSLGVNLLAALTRKVAEALDADFDIEILEMHHRHKIDAPSGTALMLGKAAAEGRGVKLDDVSVRVRDGHTGARKRGDIGFATLRGGSVVGEHTVMFAADGEVIELKHHAADRGIFARGAVKAALWGHGKPPGLYSMADVLGIDATSPSPSLSRCRNETFICDARGFDPGRPERDADLAGRPSSSFATLTPQQRHARHLRGLRQLHQREQCRRQVRQPSVRQPDTLAASKQNHRHRIGGVRGVRPAGLGIAHQLAVAVVGGRPAARRRLR